MFAGGSGPGVPLRALLVDGAPHGPALRDQIAAGVRGAPLTVDHVPTLAAAVDRLGARRYDVVLLALPEDTDRLAPFLTLAEQRPDVPVIVLIAAEDDAAGTEALEAGAQDALVRGHLQELSVWRAVRHAVARHCVQASLHAIALVDELTGLYNRRGFLTLARQQIKSAERMRRGLVHIYADFDGLKAINDTFGHREGDLALIETADILRATFREFDVLSRLGGDEFAVLALQSEEATAELLLQRLRSGIADRNARGHRQYDISLSLGATSHDPDQPCVVEELISAADSLMYQQKRSRMITPLGVAALPQPGIRSIA
ncbi:MAG: GGDEF domain-containing response regulator [Gemmatimonadota bacterium]|nr:GGDEF domain-containing response regulator [Gemmatimonadota bacterium]